MPVPYNNEIVPEKLEIKMGDTVTVSVDGEKAKYIITGCFQSTNSVELCFAMNLDGSTKIEIDYVNYATYSLSDTLSAMSLKRL